LPQHGWQRDLRVLQRGLAYGRFGERHATETHLIQIVLQVASASGRECNLREDYPTPTAMLCPGLLPVTDLAERTCLALRHAQPGDHRIYNWARAPVLVSSCRHLPSTHSTRDPVDRRHRGPVNRCCSGCVQRVGARELGWQTLRPTWAPSSGTRGRVTTARAQPA